MTEHAHKTRQALSMTTILGFCVWYCHTRLNQLRVIFWCSHANSCQACRFLCVYLPYKFPQLRSVKKHRLVKSHKVNTAITEPTETRSMWNLGQVSSLESHANTDLTHSLKRHHSARPCLLMHTVQARQTLVYKTSCYK